MVRLARLRSRSSITVLLREFYVYRTHPNTQPGLNYMVACNKLVCVLIKGAGIVTLGMKTLTARYRVASCFTLLIMYAIGICSSDRSAT